MEYRFVFFFLGQRCLECGGSQRQAKQEYIASRGDHPLNPVQGNVRR